jgi:putative zinc finger protein
MLTMSCADVRCELSAYHDQELSIGERIAIADHLENCPGCAVEADDLMTMREALQVSHHTERVAWGPMVARLQSDVLSRLAAEERVSLGTWTRELLEDRRRVLATAASALAACLLVVFGLCRFLTLGTVGHPDSLQALLEHEEKVWAARAEMPVLLPRVNPETMMPVAVVSQSDGDESLSAFSALVTSDGQLARLEFLGEESATPVTNRVSRKQLESDLMAAAATASFQPARQAAGEPIALNVVWIVTHSTVRATAHATATAHARIEVTSTFRYKTV